MINNHFVVSQRESVWQFSYRGDVTGPFASREAAVKAAIEAAGKLDGGSVEVVVHDADLRAETVWRSDQTRAASPSPDGTLL